MTDPIIVHNAITLTQPYASLMDIGAKRVETRSRRTGFRGWVAIHAGKRIPDVYRDLVVLSPFYEALRELENYRCVDDLPLGVVLCAIKIIGCRRTEDVSSQLPSREVAFGDYTPGRFAFFTEGPPRRLHTPFPARGFQSIPWKLPRPITEADLA